MALASANGLSRVRRSVPYLWTSPWAVFEVADVDASWYLHALFGLRTRSVKFLNAVFAPHLVAWLGLRPGTLGIPRAGRRPREHLDRLADDQVPEERTHGSTQTGPSACRRARARVESQTG